MKEEKIEVLPFRFDETKKFEQARAIRERVFVIEQKVDERDEFDEYEELSKHYLLIVNDKAVGTARWRQVGNKVKLERFAIDKAYRNKGYGAKLLSKVISDAKTIGKPLYLHAQLKAIPFYSRQGFEKVGDLFLECDIEHYKMVLEV